MSSGCQSVAVIVNNALDLYIERSEVVIEKDFEIEGEIEVKVKK